MRKVEALSKDRKVDLEDSTSIKDFLKDLDADDGYCKRSKRTADPQSKLIKNHLLWTGLLLEDDDLERAITSYTKAYPEKTDFMRLLVGRHFRPSASNSIPITTIEGSTSIEAISRIFSTLNSTGKMLTPFELVVSILFPQDIRLNSDVEFYRELEPYYAKIDATGDILLQTIALFDDKDTKKASLPKTITKANYEAYNGTAVSSLAECAKFISDRLGLGLDSSSELLAYPVIFTPLAYVWRELEAKNLSAGQRAHAEQKLAKWFVGAVLSRRYQQSTHDKQARDKTDMLRWIEDDSAVPEWMSEAYITRLRSADPDSAIGKFLRAVMNARGIVDPLTARPVGVGSSKMPSAKHHIFPTRWVHHLAGWNSQLDSANLALNIMYVEDSTNGSWMNCDPRDQVNQSISARGSKDATREIYRAHGINDAALEILLKPEKTRQDFYDFISERESFFAGNITTNFGFARPTDQSLDDEIDDDDEK